MQPPAKAANESARIDALKATGLLDTAPEERFDRVTRLASRMLGVEKALVTLVDTDRQWFKSAQGFDARQTGRDESFCGHAILQADLFEIPDTHNDERFADNPYVVGEPRIRFYAGVPLSTPDGYRLGTLCVLDSKPRQLADNERAALLDLAAIAEQEVNRQFDAELQAIAAQRRQLEVWSAGMRKVAQGLALTDSDGQITWCNHGLESFSGQTLAALAEGGPLVGMTGERTDRRAQDTLRRALSEHRGARVDLLLYLPDSDTPSWCQVRAVPRYVAQQFQGHVLLYTSLSALVEYINSL